MLQKLGQHCFHIFFGCFGIMKHRDGARANSIQKMLPYGTGGTARIKIPAQYIPHDDVVILSQMFDLGYPKRTMWKPEQGGIDQAAGMIHILKILPVTYKNSL